MILYCLSLRYKYNSWILIGSKDGRLDILVNIIIEKFDIWIIRFYLLFKNEIFLKNCLVIINLASIE